MRKVEELVNLINEINSDIYLTYQERKDKIKN